MSKYKEYRESLESFVKEQMIGPGGCAFQFGIDGEDLRQNEVLTTTPGQIYSSAILFPSDNSKEDAENAGQVPGNHVTNHQNNSHMPEVAIQDNDEDNNDDDGDPNNTYDQDDNGALTSTSRRYPTSMGISCCVNELQDIRQLSITISGRYYTEIPRTDYSNVYIVVSPEDITGLEDLIRRYNGNYNLRNSFMLDSDNRKLFSIAEYNPGNFRAIERDEAQRIAGADTRLYNNYTLDIYKGILYDRIIHGNELEQISLDLNESKDSLIAIAKEKIKNIEDSQRYISYLKDISLLYNKNIYGFWKAIPFKTKLDLNSIEFQDSSPKHVYKPNDYACLNNIVNSGASSLSVWIQTTKNVRDPRDNRLYFRVQLVNNGEFHSQGNDHFSPNIGAVNKLCFFGNRIEITTNTDVISQYNEQTYSLLDTEKNDLNDLYRKKTCYAAGHVCSVDWKIEGESISIFSEFMPSAEIPSVSPQPQDPTTGESLITDVRCLDMKFLSTFNDNNDTTIQNTLLVFASNYENWLNRQRELVGKDNGDRDIENNRINKCIQDLNRLRNNINEFLAPGTGTMRYFRLMNSAMYVQWWHKSDQNRNIARYSLGQNVYLDDVFYRARDEYYSWRPFQLAFILLNLDGIFHSKNDRDWEKRNKEADLVWFPTGGGKTEAYLGLIALSIINRRKALNEDDGVAVIMRYTLRLLTTQQFQRALQLISALEQLRKIGLAGNLIYTLGNTPISIGVFSGKASLPNSIAGDDNSLDDLGRAFNINPNSSKLPVDKCPICGGNLQYYTGGIFRCQTPHCSFGDTNGLPVKLCDELLYREPPTLLFGTVDKFAQLAFKVNMTDGGDSRRLFGVRATRDRRTGTIIINRVAPPSLIIQDELHLLSGPLGSSVGLFENIINCLCTDSYGNKPKIITSTATMRNADFQIQAIYNRKLNVFPHNGVYSHDSFFSYETESKRKYVGILPTGRTQMTTQLMLASAILVHRAVYEDKFKEMPYFNAVQDAYYTSISYFNSIKEVGRTSAQFDIEVKKYASRVFRRVLRPHSMLESHYLPTYGYEKEELTGRAEAGTVVQTLAALKKNWMADHRDAHIEGNDFIRGERYIDFVLATNMISVGIDVERFNIMIINSMPRNVAEYIQASSRVGRKEYGLVYTLFSPSRIRDLSYYENFKQFHDKMYSYVEPLSVTPFSDNCIENYLPLALAAYVRQKYTDLSYNVSAANIDLDSIETIRRDFIGIFEEIYNNCSGSNNSRIIHILNSLDSIRNKTNDLLLDWYNLAQRNQELVYSRTPGIRHDTPELFCSPDGLIPGHWVVANNLRNVEANSVIEADEN